MPCVWSEARTTPRAMGEKETPWTEAGCPTAAWIAGMVLQHSWPWCPWVEHCIDLQHCIACSGVVMPVQSEAYVAIATASTANRSGLAKPIPSRLEASMPSVKLFDHPRLLAADLPACRLLAHAALSILRAASLVGAMGSGVDY
jgi:hypothetical protein